MSKDEIRVRIKTQAKEKLQGNWGYAILIALPAVIFDFVGGRSDYNSTFNDYAAGYGFSFPTFAFLNTTVMGILAFVAAMAARYAFLNYFRSEKREPQPFLQTINAYGESKGLFWGTIVVWILQFVLTALWFVVFIIPGIIKSYSYSQAFFVYKDAKANGENISYMDAITRSRQLMDGHKFELFVMQLSFIGWGILATISFGIGMIWLVPYMDMSFAGFYDYLKEDLAKKQTEEA